MKGILQIIKVTVGIVIGLILLFMAIAWVFPGDSDLKLRDDGNICFTRLYWLTFKTTDHCFKPIPEADRVLPPNVHPESKKWRCRVVVTCQHVDWRYFDPEDVCTYEMMTFTMPNNPAEDPETRGTVSPSYGGWCEGLEQ